MNSAQEGLTPSRGRGKRLEILARGDGSLRPGRVRAHQVGRHRSRRRRRRNRAVSLLRVQAALPVRDHGRGHRGFPRGSWRSPPPSPTPCARSAVMASLLRADRARRAAQPRARRRAGPALQPPAPPKPEEQARQAARSRMRELEFAWASFLAARDARRGDPGTDPRLLTRAVLGLYNSIWHWYRPNGLIALDRVAEILHGARAGRGRPAAGRPRRAPLRHELLRALLRRPRRPGAVLRRWSSCPTRSSSRSNGRPAGIARRRSCAAARTELRAFIDAGDMDGWAHYVVWSARDGDTEFALGETRWDDGRFIGTFLAVAHLDADGR